MKVLRTLTEEEFGRAAAKLRHPAPGSRIEAAKEFGIDLSLLIENLRLPPEQRFQRMQDAARFVEEVRGIARKRK